MWLGGCRPCRKVTGIRPRITPRVISTPTIVAVRDHVGMRVLEAIVRSVLAHLTTRPALPISEVTYYHHYHCAQARHDASDNNGITFAQPPLFIVTWASMRG